MTAHTPCTLAGALALFAIVGASTALTAQAAERESLELGSFSVSLTVKDIRASKAFYEKLDFKQVGGKLEQNWVVLQNGSTTIGLFQGMFDKNIMTFNPGWAATHSGSSNTLPAQHASGAPGGATPYRRFT